MIEPLQQQQAGGSWSAATGPGTWFPAQPPPPGAVTSQWANLWSLIGRNDPPAARCNDYILQILWNQCVLRTPAEMNHRFCSVCPTVDIPAAKVLFFSSLLPNKRLVLLKVDRNSTKAKILQHGTLWRVCTEDMEPPSPRIVCIKDAGGAALGSGGSSGFGIFCLSKLQTVKQSARKAAAKYKVEGLNCLISMTSISLLPSSPPHIFRQKLMTDSDINTHACTAASHWRRNFLEFHQTQPYMNSYTAVQISVIDFLFSSCNIMDEASAVYISFNMRAGKEKKKKNAAAPALRVIHRLRSANGIRLCVENIAV